ncbi:MAG: OmpA family protein [Saprospiraceae bacterium]
MKIFRWSLLWLILFWACQQGYSQYIDVKTAEPSLKKKYQKAVTFYQTGQNEKAISEFKKLLDKNSDFIDAALMLGSVYYDLRNFDQAEIYFQKVLMLNPKYNQKVYYTLALTNYQNRHFQQAAENLKIFIDLNFGNPELLNRAKLLYPTYHFADSASRTPVEIEPVQVPGINSEFNEFLPSLTADGRTMVFTRLAADHQEDLLISYRGENDLWSTPVPIDELNTAMNEGAPAISGDGNTLVFVSCHRPEGLGGCDLYVSYRRNNHWTAAVNLGERINTPAFESQPCLADNGNILFFCSDRIGGIGGRDIWMAVRGKKNEWTKPVNLGSPVNTAGNEECPFLHQDGRTLYFSSNGHIGMGGMDLFLSRNEKNKIWSQPVNLGYPINTPLDESSFVAFYDGKKALMASDRLFQNEKDPQKIKKINLDIFELTIPEIVKPVPSCYIRFNVVDAKDHHPLAATIELFRIEDKKLIVSEILGASGQKTFSLPGGGIFAINISHPGYQLLSEQFDCTANSRFNPSYKIWAMKPIGQEEERVVLKNIFFSSGSTELQPESFFELDHIVKILKTDINSKIHILGHTDNIGSEETNELLSGRRAESVAAYLISGGIEKSRITSEGRGEKEPVADNSTEEGRRQNRRTEFLIKH